VSSWCRVLLLYLDCLPNGFNLYVTLWRRYARYPSPGNSLLLPSWRDSEVTCTSTHQKWSNFRQTIKLLDLISYLFCFLSPSLFTYLVSSIEIMHFECARMQLHMLRSLYLFANPVGHVFFQNFHSGKVLIKNISTDNQVLHGRKRLREK